MEIQHTLINIYIGRYFDLMGNTNGEYRFIVKVRCFETLAGWGWNGKFWARDGSALEQGKGIFR